MTDLSGQLARNYLNVMERILEAFTNLAHALPRLDRLKATFPEDTNFNQVVGLIYSDIIEFHRRAYKFFRRKAWHFWFAFDWGLFERRFKSILQRLALHCDLLDKEAAAAHFFEMKQFRDKHQLEEDAFERRRQHEMAQDVFRWLSEAEDQQEEHLHRISDNRQPETCDWILKDPQMRPWIEDDCGDAILWMNGIPGAGKSFLCSLVIENLQSQQHLSTLYFFCSHQSSSENKCAVMLRTLAIQLLQQNSDMAPLVHQAYLQKGSNRSSPAMKNLLIKLLPSSKAARIVIDGMDEISHAAQQELIKNLIEIQKSVDPCCKLLVSSRDEPQIQKSLATKNHLNLGGKTVESISLYIKDRIKGLQEFSPAINATLVSFAEQQLQNKAKGMFLYVRLVTDMLKDQMSELDFENAINQLPEGLDEAYGRILSRIESLRPAQLRQRAFSILYWVCAARRPILLHEVADGIVLNPRQTTLNRRTRSNNPNRDIIELCAPLLEMLKDGVLDLVHFSAKEYVIHEHSGPFVDLPKAHLSIALSCVINLKSCLDLVPRNLNGISEGELESRVVQGYYGLQSYGQEFWAEHVLAYLEKVGDRDRVSRELISALEAFSQVWKHRHSCTLSPSALHTSEASLGLHYLRDSPMLQRFISSWLRFKFEFEKIKPTFDSLDSEEQWRKSKDETFLSLIKIRLCNLTERLLMMQSSQLPSHIDENDFKQFVNRYRFSCRYQDCIYQCDTIQERDSHEMSHALSFPCLQCDFSGRGFRSRRDLEKHTQKYHMSPEDFEIPDDLHSSRGDSNVTSGAFRMPSSRSGDWSEQGRKAIQQGLQQVVTRLESEATAAKCDSDKLGSGDNPSTETAGPRLSQQSNETVMTLSLDPIRHKIEKQNYVSLADFKNDLRLLAGDQTMAFISVGDGQIGSICDEEFEKAMSAFPAFANFDHTISTKGTTLASSIDNFEQLQGFPEEVDEKENDKESASLVSLGTRVPYWSQPEEKQFPELLQRYGRDFAKIAGHLKTKTPQEVNQHFVQLLSMGKSETSDLADPADAEIQQKACSIETETGTGNAELEMRVSDDFALESSHYFLQSGEASNAEYISSYVGNPNIPPPLTQSITKRVGQNLGPDENPDGPVRKKRRPQPRAPCPHCSLHKDGLRDEWALKRHIERFHTATRKIWICEDISIGSRFLNKCKSCSASKRYSSKSKAGEHLRKVHFNAKTSNETLQRWMREIEEPNPNMKTPSAGSTWTTRPTAKEKNTRRRTLSLPPLKHHLDSSRTLPNTIFETKSRKLSRPASRSRSSSSRDDDLDGNGEIDGKSISPSPEADFRDDTFFKDISFDNFLPTGASATRLLDTDGPPHRANRALITPDQILRLPNLDSFRKTACSDQVEALHHQLDNVSRDSSDYKEALENLTWLSRWLMRNLRDWRRTSTLAPQIPFSI